VQIKTIVNSYHGHMDRYEAFLWQRHFDRLLPVARTSWSMSVHPSHRWHGCHTQCLSMAYHMWRTADALSQGVSDIFPMTGTLSWSRWHPLQSRNGKNYIMR